MSMNEKFEPESDELLIANVTAGNEKAFAELVRRHHVKILNLINYFINDPLSSEDICQEVFLRVWKHAAKFKGKSKFSTWLYRIVINLCLNHKRDRKKEISISYTTTNSTADYASQEMSSTSQESPHQLLEKNERERIVNQSLQFLPAKQRMALILSKFNGHSYAEIADLMNVSIPAVESLLFRAKQNMIRFLYPLKEKGEL